MWFGGFWRKVFLFLSVSSALFCLISANNEENGKNKKAQITNNLEGGPNQNNIVYFLQNPSLSTLVTRAKGVLKRRISESWKTIEGVGDSNEGSGNSGPTHRNQDEWSSGRRVTLDDKGMKLMGLLALLTIFQGVLEAVSSGTGRKRKKRHAFFNENRRDGILAASELNEEVLKDLRLRFGGNGGSKEATQLECIYKRVCELNKLFSDSRGGFTFDHFTRRLFNGPIELDRLRMAAQVGQMGKSCSNYLPKCPS